MIEGAVVKLDDGTWTVVHSDENISNLAELLESLPVGTLVQIVSPNETQNNLSFDFMGDDPTEA